MARHGFELKTNEQIILMREAGLATAAALKAVREAIKPGISTLELDKIADDTINSLGGHSNFQLVPGYSHTICASINDEVVHGIPAVNRILQAGDIVSIDCGAEIGEWNGDSAITVIVPGEINPDTLARRQKLSDVTEGSLWAGIAALAKAKHLNQVGEAIQDYIEAQGQKDGINYGILEEYVGHGIGRSMHEDPAVYNYRVRGNGPKVVPGLVVAIEPMVTAGSAVTKVLGDGWTVSTKDASDASHWEHSVAVHDRGIWVLTAEDGGVAGLAPFGVVPVPLN
ncbi:type I methionyl aminopeptidase [Rhodoluna lacicola]|uniref:type I methionyl aminopeptidase n=1 Tax=Rhodoluna lacicola TaxID=529884 RepID=UPI0022319141|nr:type I methionyl aminopeptidase [Rhodoluna lacicola]BDS50919.1 methionine aminopeptidase [Rhodoluna lacicola]